MVKHKRRKYRRYLRGDIDIENALGTLLTRDVISQLNGGVVAERTFVSSVKATHTLQDFALDGNDGPISIGIAHSDYTDAEIEAWLENAGSWDEGNKIQQEIARRKIKLVGTFEGLGAAAEITQIFALNDGKPILTKLNWILTTGQTLRFWAYNAGASTLATGSSVFSRGHANLWPQ